MLQINKHTVFILIIAFNTRPCYILGTRLAMYVKTALREPPIIDSIKPQELKSGDVSSFPNVLIIEAGGNTVELTSTFIPSILFPKTDCFTIPQASSCPTMIFDCADKESVAKKKQNNTLVLFIVTIIRSYNDFHFCILIFWRPFVIMDFIASI